MAREFYYIICFCVGLGVCIQAGVNSQLQLLIKSPLISALVSFLVGTIVLLAVILIKEPKSFSNLSNLIEVKWWQLLGGLMGAIYIFSVIIAAPQIGIASTVSWIVVSQLIFSVIFDHFGWLGFPIKPISVYKVVGIVFLIIGLFLTKK